MSTNNSAKEDYERALGGAHHDNQTNQDGDQKFPWWFYALLIIAIAMTVYGGAQFLIRMGGMPT